MGEVCGGVELGRQAGRFLSECMDEGGWLWTLMVAEFANQD